MSLYRQLTILITFFLILILGIILVFVIKYNKNLIENQLFSNAKNSASFLALTISKNVSLEDKATIEGMLSSVLDNGFYEYIVIYDEDDRKIVEVENLQEEEKVASWFKELIFVKALSSKAEIMKGWEQKGNIEVKIDKNYANNKLWKTFKSISQIFVLLTLVLLLILYFVINRLLNPLKKLNIQAKAIDDNEFIIEKKLPKTDEFKSVVQAMNNTITKLKTIFEKEVEILNKYNKLMYTDNLTQLNNRDYMMLKLNLFSKNSYGLLVFFEIKDEIALKKKIGFKSYDTFKKEIIKTFKESFKDNTDLVFSRLNDETLALLVPHTYLEDEKRKLEKIVTDIKEYIHKMYIDELFEIKFALGVASYKQDDNITNILTKTDEALKEAFVKNINLNYVYGKNDLTKEKTSELLNITLEENEVYYESQDIVDVDSRETYIKEYFSIFKDEKANDFKAEQFFNSNKDKVVSQEKRFLEEIITQSDKGRYAVNISADFVKKKQNVLWLETKLQNISFDVKFYFECLNRDIVMYQKEYEFFYKILLKTNHKFAIESFSFQSENLEYLKTLKPAYLKISKHYFLGKESDVTNSILSNITSAIGADLVVKHLDEKEEFYELAKLGIRYMQGLHIDEIKVK